MDAPLPSPLTRPRSGRWAGGVCAGLAARWSVPVRRVRAAFALTTPLLGLGLFAYVAFWLIVPAEGEAGGPPGSRGVVVIAQAAGAVLALVALAVAGGAATVFGYGWVVVALAAAVLAGTLALWPRTGPAWALLPIGAAVLPSVALAAGGLHLEPTATDVVMTPRTVPSRTLHSGLGELTVDLRKSALRTSGVIGLRIDAGVRRTLVALPHDRCVRVEVHQRPLPFAVRAGSVLLGAGTAQPATVTAFGEPGTTHTVGAKRPGPTLRIDFSSAGGDLVVRDYPDDVFPTEDPSWPGYLLAPEPRPDLSGLSKRASAARLRAWRHRRGRQAAANDRFRPLQKGPCAVRAAR